MAKILRFDEFKFESMETEDNFYLDFKVKTKDSHNPYTDAVISGKKALERAIKTGFVSCGNGCDYKLKPEELQQLKDGEFDTFKPTKEIK